MNCLQCGQPLAPLQHFCDTCGAPAVPAFNATPLAPEEHTPSTWRIDAAEMRKAQSAEEGPLLKATPTHIMPIPPPRPLLQAPSTQRMEELDNVPRFTAAPSMPDIDHNATIRSDLPAFHAPVAVPSEAAPRRPDESVGGSLDLEAIGWWVRYGGKEVGPVSRVTLRNWLEQNVLPPQAELRHALELEWTSLEASFPEGGPKGERNMAWRPPQRRTDRINLARGDVPCLAHPSALAVTACHRCHTPVCEHCISHLDAWLCRPCYLQLFQRRGVAWLLEACVLPLVVGIVATFASHSRVITLIAVGVCMVYVLLRDIGRGSLGKRLVSLRVVDAISGQPCTLRQSLVRNVLTALAMTVWLAPAPIIEFLFVSRGPRMERPLDRMAGTVVVDTPEALKLARAAARQAWLKRPSA